MGITPFSSAPLGRGGEKLAGECVGITPAPLFLNPVGGGRVGGGAPPNILASCNDLAKKSNKQSPPSAPGWCTDGVYRRTWRGKAGGGQGGVQWWGARSLHCPSHCDKPRREFSSFENMDFNSPGENGLSGRWAKFEGPVKKLWGANFPYVVNTKKNRKWHVLAGGQDGIIGS